MIWLFVLGAALAGAPFVAELARQPVQAVRKGADLAKLSRGQTRYLWFGSKDGPVIVLVHGLTTPSPVFDAVAAGLARQGARVLTYDLYGRGRSDRPGGAQTRDVFVRQLRELLVDQRVTEPITLVGYSMGGVIATAYSAKYLDQVERLVLLASAGLCHKFDRFTAFCVKAPWIGDWLMVLFGPRGLRRVAEEVRHLDSQVPDIAEVIEAETRMRGYMPAVLSSLRNCLVGDQRRTHGALANTGLPVLAIWGDEDTVIPPEAQDQLAEANPAARQVRLTAAGHGLPFTHADRIVDEIAQFGLVEPGRG